ncbi:hypothetical protein SLA2020_483170 [Shorea laevis]
MGFNKVYQALMDIFPQVDQRILKAVAIENSRDVDAAAETVLSDILPHLSKNSTTSPVQEPSPIIQLDDEVSSDEESSKLRVRRSGKTASSSSESVSEEHEKFPNMGLSGSSWNDDSAESQTSVVSELPGKDCGLNESSVVSMLEEHGNSVQSADSVESQISMLADFPGKDVGIIESSVDIDSEELVLLRKGTLNCSTLGVESDVTQMVLSSSQENSPDSPKDDLHVEVGSGKGDGSLGLQSKQDPVNEMGDSDNEPDLDVVDTCTGQICRIDMLQEIIEDAKNNKKTLFQVMQSVMDFMREVELDEEAAEQAKEEAARGGLDILVKVEELKKMLAHAKEANDLHAGEVYGEKSILATEVRELQNRLLILSEERDQSLAILDEMCQTLEVRQAAAEWARKEAEQEKLEKEESARNALAEQEALMEMVVKESKILQQEAEENSKLREFLMNCGHIVDLLQGEISVICQDVRLLKEKFDERIPLSKSISSSQTSCILASSGSSVKSMASELIPNQVESVKTPEKISPPTSVDSESPKGRPGEEFDAIRKELMEDGWDFFEEDAECCS